MLEMPHICSDSPFLFTSGSRTFPFFLLFIHFVLIYSLPTVRADSLFRTVLWVFLLVPSPLSIKKTTCRHIIVPRVMPCQRSNIPCVTQFHHQYKGIICDPLIDNPSMYLTQRNSVGNSNNYYHINVL